jgi:hypothetical protein
MGIGAATKGDGPKIPAGRRTSTRYGNPRRRVQSAEKKPYPKVAAGPRAVVAAGDMADCRSDGEEATAKLFEGLEGTVLVLGDETYPEGSAKDFENTAGRHGAFQGAHQARSR